MRVASFTLERTRDSLQDSLGSTSDVASRTEGRRFRPVRSAAPRAPGGGFVLGPCDAVDTCGDAVTVSSGGTSGRLTVPEAGIPDALCRAEGVRRRLAERRGGDRQSRSPLANLRQLSHGDGRPATGRLEIVVPAASVISVRAKSRDSLAELFQLGGSSRVVGIGQQDNRGPELPLGPLRSGHSWPEFSDDLLDRDVAHFARGEHGMSGLGLDSPPIDHDPPSVNCYPQVRHFLRPNQAGQIEFDQAIRDRIAAVGDSAEATGAVPTPAKGDQVGAIKPAELTAGAAESPVAGVGCRNTAVRPGMLQLV